MKWRLPVILACALVVAHAASAQHTEEAARIARDGGSVVGSSKACGIALPNEAMADLVRTHAGSGATFEFIDDLNAAASKAESEIGAMSAAAKQAHCSAMVELAKAMGMIR